MVETGLRDIGATLPGHYGADAIGTVISAVTTAAVWNVQGDPARSSVVADAERLLGVSLPVEPNTACRAQSLLALWMGPRSWLLIEGGLSGRPAALVDFDAKRDALNVGGGALFDVSASRVAFTIRGTRAESALARSCPLDFDSRVFLPGHCAQGVFGRVPALYYRHESTPGFTVMVSRSLATDVSTPGFTVMVSRSLATDVWRALCVSAASDGYDVGLSAAFDAA